MYWVYLAKPYPLSQVWMYWAYLAFNFLDAVTHEVSPPARYMLWSVFTAWVLYLVLSPLHWYPLPFGGLAPGAHMVLDHAHIVKLA